jgi:hypothetical protein
VAHFSPAVLAVWEGFSEFDLARDEKLLNVPGGLKDLTPEVVQALRRLSIRHHEWAHYRQHVTTMIGAFTYRVALAKTLYTMRVATRLGDDVRLSALAIGRPDQRRRLLRSHPDLHDDLERWTGAHVLGSVFWKKSVAIGVLRRFVARTFDMFHDLPLSGSTEVRLIFDGPDDEYCGPLGTIPVEMLSEGLARYRESLVLNDLLGQERGYTFWHTAATRIGEGSIALVQERLKVPVIHPIVGAVHEVALAACPDLGSVDEPVRFRDAHPGFRFRRMLSALSDSEVNFDRTRAGIEHSYEVAVRAAGLEPGELEARYATYASDMLIDRRRLTVRQLTYWEGARARSVAPWVVSFPEEAVSFLEPSTVQHLRPPLVVQPRRTVTNSRPSAAMSFGWSMIMLVWDLLQDGRSLAMVRRIVRGLPSAVSDDYHKELRWYLENLPPRNIHARVERYLFRDD